MNYSSNITVGARSESPHNNGGSSGDKRGANHGDVDTDDDERFQHEVRVENNGKTDDINYQIYPSEKESIIPRNGDQIEITKTQDRYPESGRSEGSNARGRITSGPNLEHYGPTCRIDASSIQPDEGRDHTKNRHDEVTISSSGPSSGDNFEEFIASLEGDNTEFEANLPTYYNQREIAEGHLVASKLGTTTSSTRVTVMPAGIQRGGKAQQLYTEQRIQKTKEHTKLIEKVANNASISMKTLQESREATGSSQRSTYERILSEERRAVERRNEVRAEEHAQEKERIIRRAQDIFRTSVMTNLEILQREKDELTGQLAGLQTLKVAEEQGINKAIQQMESVQMHIKIASVEYKTQNQCTINGKKAMEALEGPPGRHYPEAPYITPEHQRGFQETRRAKALVEQSFMDVVKAMEISQKRLANIENQIQFEQRRTFRHQDVSLPPEPMYEDVSTVAEYATQERIRASMANTATSEDMQELDDMLNARANESMYDPESAGLVTLEMLDEVSHSSTHPGRYVHNAQQLTITPQVVWHRPPTQEGMWESNRTQTGYSILEPTASPSAQSIGPPRVSQKKSTSTPNTFASNTGGHPPVDKYDYQLYALDMQNLDSRRAETVRAELALQARERELEAREQRTQSLIDEITQEHGRLDNIRETIQKERAELHALSLSSAVMMVTQSKTTEVAEDSKASLYAGVQFADTTANTNLDEELAREYAEQWPGMVNFGLNYLVERDMRSDVLQKQRRTLGNEAAATRIALSNSKEIRHHLRRSTGISGNNRIEALMDTVDHLIAHMTETEPGLDRQAITSATSSGRMEQVMDTLRQLRALEREAAEDDTKLMQQKVRGKDSVGETADMQLSNTIREILHGGDETSATPDEMHPDTPVIRAGELIARLLGTMIEVEFTELRMRDLQLIRAVILDHITTSGWYEEIEQLLQRRQRRKAKTPPSPGHDNLKRHKDDDHEDDGPPQGQKGTKQTHAPTMSASQNKRPRGNNGERQSAANPPPGSNTKTAAGTPHKDVKGYFYAVHRGRNPGVYLTWEDCRRQTDGYSNAIHKRCNTYEEAVEFANQSTYDTQSVSSISTSEAGSLVSNERTYTPVRTPERKVKQDLNKSTAADEASLSTRFKTLSVQAPTFRYDPAKFSTANYHDVVKMLKDKHPEAIDQINNEIIDRFEQWWAAYKLGLSQEKVRLAGKLNSMAIPWASATSPMQQGHIDKCVLLPGTKDKVDVTQMAKVVIFHMESRQISPKQAYMVLQLAQFLPEGARYIVNREVQQQEAGGIFDVKLDANGNDIVLWVVAVKKLLVRYSELIGVAVNEQVGIARLVNWKMDATTVPEIVSEVREMIDIALQVGMEKFHVDVLIGHVITAMSRGTPQSEAFSVALQGELELRRTVKAMSKIDTPNEGSKAITDLVAAVEARYEAGQKKLPPVIDTDRQQSNKRGVRPSNALQTSNGHGDNANQESPKCPTCGMNQHHRQEQYGCLYYDINKKEWKDRNIAKGIKNYGKDVFGELAQNSHLYNALTDTQKRELRKRVEDNMSSMPEPDANKNRGYRGGKTPDGVATVITGTSGSISVVNYVTGQAEDNLVILKARAVDKAGEHKGKKVLAQYDPGSVVTIGDEDYLRTLGAKFEERPQHLVVGFNGVIKGAGTQWITHDAVINLRFAMERVSHYDEKTGDPITTGEKLPIWVILKCGVVKGLGLPLLIGGDAIKSMGLRTYDALPVATIERKYMMNILSLEEAQTEAQAAGDRHWGATIEEEHRQVHRATLVAGSSRITILPHEARVLKLSGCSEIEPQDVSTVEVFSKAEAKLSKNEVVIEGGIHAGIPRLIIVNKGTEPVTLYKGAIKATVKPQKMRRQFIYTPQTPEAITEMKKIIVSHQTSLQTPKITSPVAAVPEALWHLMKPEAKSAIAANYSAFNNIRQLEMITELLSKADIFDSDEKVEEEWLAMVDEEMSHNSWQIFDPGPDIPPDIRTAYMQEVEKLNQRIRDGRYKTQRHVLLAQLIAVPNVIYHPDPENPRLAKGELCTLHLTDQIPIVSRPRRYTWVQKAFMTAKTTIMLKQGKLEEGEGDYTSALVLVPYDERIKASLEKWGDHAEEQAKDPNNFAEVATWYRMTSDFRDLNAKTIAESFPLPRIDDLLDCVRRGTKIYTSGDIADAFFCIELDKESRKYTGFRTHDRQFQYKVMPQGGKNCASRFSRIVAKIFKDIDEKDALKYMDDVLVHSETFDKHMDTLWRVYQCLIEHQLTFKLSKLHIGYSKIKFLGHIMTSEGRLPDAESVEAIDKLAYPNESQEAVRQFLGMTVYYKDYIPGYSDIAMPLYTLTRKNIDVKEEWAKNPKLYNECVDKLKMALISAPCLRPPDSRRKFRVVVDACRRGRGLGAVILQQYDDGWHPVAYWSKSLSKTEKEYSPTELECKAMHDVILKFDVYLRHKEFEVITDHNALVYMVKAQTQQNNGRLMRYLMDLQPYDFTVTYRKGEEHMDADAISRLLRQGEVPEYLTADDVETDKGPVTEEEIEIATELAEKKKRHIQHIIKAKQAKAQERSEAMFKQAITSQNKEESEDKNEKEDVTIPQEEVKTLINICCAGISTRVLRPRSQQKPNYTGTNPKSRPRRDIKKEEGSITKKVRFKEAAEESLDDTSNIKESTREVANSTTEEEEVTDNEEADRVTREIQQAVADKKSYTSESHEEKVRSLQAKIEERRLTQKTYRGGDQRKQKMDMEKYAFDNIIQSPMLAEELQYLIGKHYIDDENGREYEITGVVYDSQYKRVVGFRKDLSGLPPTPHDQNTAYEVFGEMGLLQLADLYNVDNYKDEVKWPGNDLAKIQEYQAQDPELCEIIEQVKAAKEAGMTHSIAGDTYQMAGSPEILVKEGNIAENRWVWQTVIPEKLKTACMQVIHDGMGHPGASRCIATTRLRYTWKNMRRDIISHVEECRQCQLRKAYTCKPAVPVMQYPECNKPMDRVHMDLTGPLPTSESGNKYILVIKDYKTKFVWIYAIKDKLATTINAIVSEELIPTFGPMGMLVTDRGTEFKNKLLKETCRLLKVDRVNTTPSNPRSNGCVEKHNSTLKDMLSMYVKENQQDWDKYVRLVTMLYNSTVNTSTGYTPYYLMFGREMNMTDDVIVQVAGNTDKQTQEQQSEELVEALTLAWELTTQREYRNYKNMNQRTEKKKRIIEYFTKLAGPNDEEHRKVMNELRSTYRTYEFREYKIGDWFYRKRHPTRAFKNDGEKEKYKITMKLQPRYDGPYRITKKINAVLYSAVIEGKEIRVHAVNMKPSASNEKTLGFDPYKRSGRKGVRDLSNNQKQSKGSESEEIRKDQNGGTTGKKTPNPKNKSVTETATEEATGEINNRYEWGADDKNRGSDMMMKYDSID